MIVREEVSEKAVEAEQVAADTETVREEVAVEGVNFGTAIEMLCKTPREDPEEDIDAMDDDENEDECEECGFLVNKLNQEDHQYCKGRVEADTAVESAPVATDRLGNEEVATKNTIDNAEGAYLLCEAECATLEGMTEQIVNNTDANQ